MSILRDRNTMATVADLASLSQLPQLQIGVDPNMLACLIM